MPQEVYVDKTGTMDKPDPMTMAFLEFPRAMTAIAAVTAFGAKKHAPRGWQTFEPNYGIVYHLSKVGRHLRDRELHGEINHADGGNYHMAAVAWNALATLENILKLHEAGLKTENDTRVIDRAKLLPIRDGTLVSRDTVKRAGAPHEDKLFEQPTTETTKGEDRPTSPARRAAAQE